MIQTVTQMPTFDREDHDLPETGFGSVIPRHDQNHGKSSFQTTNQAFYGEEQKMNPRQTVTKFNETANKTAGGEKWATTEAVKKISGLTGEVFNKYHDPQEASEVQRTWIQKKDPAIEVVKAGIHERDQTLPFDNANSLPLGNGEHEYVVAQMDSNAYRKKRTDITQKQGTKPVLYRG